MIRKNPEFSNPWKNSRPIFQSLENSPKLFPTLGKLAKTFSNPWKTPPALDLGPWTLDSSSSSSSQSGAALIVALWVIIILSLLISAFAFDMHVESGITSFYRKRLKAQYAAQAGVEYAKFLLVQSYKANNAEESDEEKEDLRIKAINLSRGVALTGLSKEIGQGKFTIDIMPEPGRRNVNNLSDEDWEEILDQGNVSEEKWPELIDCFNDWIDESDEHRLNGAESDDSFYEERGYEVKNAKLDTVDELLLIKGFSPAIVYGGPSENEGEESYPGIAQFLTTWGDGKLNVNTASKEVLMTLPDIDEWVVDDIVEGRVGKDQTEGTKDDGWDSVDEVMSQTGLNADLREKITVSDRKYVRLVSIGEIQGVKSGIWCILSADETSVTPVFWREETMR
ncbi:MAG TPA: hypothetical protein DCZ95_12120 [Verrucomicrobia bacterium]|nr:MAG: hypothetical protein A2X46_14170 [Lentisphaerae bacterium GWF2_57_35]HBA84831.1 hypothetical protein [Verrucomicrobiota bacterium]